MKVAVLYGGTSAEREISLKSGSAVYQAIVELGYDVDLLDTKDADTLPRLQTGGYDKVFPALHGRGGEDGVIQGVLEFLRLPYVGSGVLASAICMDKHKSKQVLAAHNINVAPAELLTATTDWQAVIERLGTPIMVKPASEGSSIGMAKVQTAAELEQAFNNAAQYDSCVLAEMWLTGREFTVSIVNGVALPVIGLKPDDAASFYDFDAKYVTGKTQYLLPSGLSAEQDEQLQQIALAAFRALECEGWGRVDIMAHQNEWYVLEANTLPGMTQSSLVPKAAKAYGWSFAQLVDQLLASAR